ncbi:MAG: DUF1269 domain-containing protein [Pseudomonadota bacterium]
MRRIHFLAPDIGCTHRIVEELRGLGIGETDIHVLAKRGTPLEGLPEANLLQKTDFIPAVERGLALGGATGLLAGLVGLSLSHIVVGGGAVLAIALGGAGVGSWVSGMVGMSVGKSKLRAYEEAIERGEFLILVDMPKDRTDGLGQVIQKHHPEAEFEGTEPILPPPL